MNEPLDLYLSIIFYLFSILVGFFRVGNYLLVDELHLYFILESDTERRIKDKDLLEEIKFNKSEAARPCPLYQYKLCCIFN